MLRRSISNELSDLLKEFDRHYLVEKRRSPAAALAVKRTTLDFLEHIQGSAPSLLAVPLFEVDAQKVDHYLRQTKAHLTPSSRKQMANRLRPIFSFLVEKRGLAGNPVGSFYAPPVEPTYDRYTEDEVRTIFGLLVDDEPREWIAARDFVVLSLYYEHRLTGVQVDGITIGDFDGLSIRTSSNGVRETILVSGDVAGAIKRYVAYLPVHLGKDDALFRNAWFRPMKWQNHILFLNSRTTPHGLRVSITKLRNSSPFFEPTNAPQAELKKHVESGLTPSLAWSFQHAHPRWWP